jgi:hypothetical protein
MQQKHGLTSSAVGVVDLHPVYFGLAVRQRHSCVVGEIHLGETPSSRGRVWSHSFHTRLDVGAKHTERDAPG